MNARQHKLLFAFTLTKMMLASAQIAHYARRAANFGVSTGDIQVNLADDVK